MVVVSRFIPLLAKAVWFQPEVTPVDGSPVDLHRTISTRPESLVTLAEQTEQMLNVVQGLCLMHEKTRDMFKREENMKVAGLSLSPLFFSSFWRMCS